MATLNVSILFILWMFVICNVANWATIWLKDKFQVCFDNKSISHQSSDRTIAFLSLGMADPEIWRLAYVLCVTHMSAKLPRENVDSRTDVISATWLAFPTVSVFISVENVTDVKRSGEVHYFSGALSLFLSVFSHSLRLNDWEQISHCFLAFFFFSSKLFCKLGVKRSGWQHQCRCSSVRHVRMSSSER